MPLDAPTKECMDGWMCVCVCVCVCVCLSVCVCVLYVCNGSCIRTNSGVVDLLTTLSPTAVRAVTSMILVIFLHSQRQIARNLT